jgi:molybdopterin synthase sulfur carrier subunit
VAERAPHWRAMLLLLSLTTAAEIPCDFPFSDVFLSPLQENPPMKIEIPYPLRPYTGNQSAVNVEAGTVAEAVSGLTSQYPDFQKHLYTPDGKLRSFVNLYLNDEDVRYLPEREDTAVKDSDTLSIIPSIAGGSCPEG